MFRQNAAQLLVRVTGLFKKQTLKNKCFSVLLKTDPNKEQPPSKLDAKLADINFKREITQS